MADLTRRTSKKLAAHLTEGELIHVAVLCEPKGTYGAGSLAIAALPRTATRLLDERAATDRDGMAGLLPASSFVLALTSDRTLVSASNGLKFADPGPIFEPGDLFAGELVRRGLGRRLTLVFADGSATEVDLQRAQPVDRLVELLGPAPTV